MYSTSIRHNVGSNWFNSYQFLYRFIPFFQFIIQLFIDMKGFGGLGIHKINMYSSQNVNKPYIPRFCPLCSYEQGGLFYVQIWS